MQEDKLSRYIRIAAIILVWIVIFISVFSFIDGSSRKTSKEIKYLKEGWVDSEGRGAGLDTFADSTEGESRFITLDYVEGNEVLFFFARNLYVDVYVDGEPYFQDKRVSSFIFGKSPGTRWHTISLQASEEPVTIELRGTASFANAMGYVDNICVGEPADIYQSVVLRYVIVVIINTLWQIIGLLLVLVYFYLKRKHPFGKDFLHLAVGTYFCAQWCNTETHVIQLLIGHSEAIHLLEYLSLFIIPIPFGLLCAEQMEKKKFAQIYSLCAEINLFVCSILHFSGIVEFHYMTWTIYIFLILLAPMALLVIKNYAANARVKSSGGYIYASFIGAVLFIGVGMIRYVTGHYEDYATYIRVALFMFLLVLIIYQLTSLNTVLKEGTQAELMRDLALTDHLTKFYNRSGFAEHQAEYEKAVENHEIMGILQFDVNDLKVVNDGQGHEKGDELLCLASSGIYQSYGRDGKCYRMGGDEFLVILWCDDPKAIYEVGQKQLDTYCYYANSVEERSFDLNIAHGFTLVEEGDTLQSAMDRADELMYKNKKFMKENKSR